LRQLDNGASIDEILGGGCLYMDFYKCNSATVNRTLYKSGCYLLASIAANAESSEYVRLLEIFVRDREDVIFFCEKSMILGLDEHFHSWSIQQITPRQYTHMDSIMLCYFFPHVVSYINVDDGERNFIGL
jgi:hypothetical protein